jgi:Spy/CpxP family protein refolding chaperone
MRRKIALGTMGLLVLLAVAVIARGEEGQAGPASRQGAHEFASQGPSGDFEHHGMDRWGGRHEFGRERGLLGLADNSRLRAYLNLTDQQAERLHQIAVDSEKSSVKTRADLELRRIELRELLRADNPDHDAVMKKVQEVSELRGQMMKQHVETLLTARSVLTPEQQKKLRSFRENRGVGGLGREHTMEHRAGQRRPVGQPGAPAAPAVPPAQPDKPPVQ